MGYSNSAVKVELLYHGPGGTQSPDLPISESLLWSYSADEASVLLNTLSLWLRKTGQVEVLCTLMSILLPARTGSTGWL